MEGGGVVGFEEIGRAGDGGVHFGAAEVSGIDGLADGGFDQSGAGQIELAVGRDDELVAEHGKIRAARDTIAHDGGELGHTRGGENRVVAEDAAKIVLVRENFILHRQIDASGIDQVNQREIAAHGDFLRAQNFFAGCGKKSAGFDGGVVGDGHDRPPMDWADLHNDAGGGDGVGAGIGS